MTDLTEDDEFNLLLDDEWDVDTPDEENDDPEAVLTRFLASLLAAALPVWLRSRPAQTPQLRSESAIVASGHRFLPSLPRGS